MVYPEAGEVVGVGSLIAEDVARDGTVDRRRVRLAVSSPRAAASAVGLESTERAERRARGQIRRYAVVNGCTRLATLTRADQTKDPATMRRDFAAFTRRLRGARPDLRWVRVFERHKSGALHVHVGLSGYIDKGELARLWGHGFVDVRKFRAGGRRESARAAARYLSKYVSKEAVADPGEHRYEVRQGFGARGVRVVSWSWDELLADARSSGYVSGDPVYVWDSATDPAWLGPPVTFAAFA